MKKYRFKSKEKKQHFYMAVCAVAMVTLAFTANRASESVNTAEAYTYEEAEQNLEKDRALIEMEYYQVEEEDVFKPAYMSSDMMKSLGVSENDIIDLPNEGKVIVKNIASMRKNVIITYNEDAEINLQDLEIYEYTKVNGGN